MTGSAAENVPSTGAPAVPVRVTATSDPREAERRLRAVLDVAQDAVVLLGPDDRVVEWNAAAERTFGWPRAETLGRPALDLLAGPEARAPLARALAAEAGAPARLEVRARRRDGTVFPAEVAVVRVPEDALRAATFRDLTERKAREAELALARGVARLANWSWEPATGRIRGSPELAQVHDPSDARGAGTLEAFLGRVHFDDRDAVRAALDATVRKGASEVAYRVLDDAGVRHVHLRAEAVGLGGGPPARVVGTCLDITELHQAEEALRASEARYRFLANAVPQQVWTAEPDGRVDYVNDRVVEFLGEAVERLRAEGWAAVAHPDDAPSATARWAAAVRSGEPLDAEMRLRRADGTHRWHIVRATPLRDGGGRVLRWFGSCTDVTELKEAVAALRDSEERHRFLAEYSTDMITRATPEGTFLYVSPASRTVLGYEPEEMVGRSGYLWIHPDDHGRAAETHREVLDGDVFTRTLRFRRKDGAYVWLETSARTVRDRARRPVEIVAVSRDVTARKRAELELERLKRRNEAILQSAGEGIYGVDLQGRATFVNPAAARMIGCEPADLVGASWHDRVHARRADGTPYPESECPIHAAFRRGEVHHVTDEVFWRADGTSFPVEYVAAPLREEGRIVGAVVVFTDVTERRRAEQELRDRASELARLAVALERSNRELDQFAYVASHDLKAPLRGIVNLSKWIEEDADALPEESRRHLNLLRGRVRRMEALIDAILEYSRVGRVRVRPEPVDVGQLLDEVVDLLAPAPSFRVVAESPLPHVVTERMRLQQVLLNLVGNAIKHHDKPAGTVRVSAQDAGGWWRFSVADDGPGIPAAYHQKVFVIFQTLQPRDKVEGTGVGLAIVKKIVESQGGTVTLESEEGRGATFRFTWPKSPRGA